MPAATGGAHGGLFIGVEGAKTETEADAAAHPVLAFAMTTSAVSGTARSSEESTSLCKGTLLQR